MKLELYTLISFIEYTAAPWCIRLFCPNLFSLKFELLITINADLEYIAPPNIFAVLFKKLQLDTTTLSPVECIAPPILDPPIPDELPFIKVRLLIVTSAFVMLNINDLPSPSMM